MEGRFFLKVEVAQSCLTLCDPMDYHGQNNGVCSLFPSPGNLPNPGIDARSPELRADSLPAEPSRKPKDTGVGSLSLLQGIFPTPESNRGLLHCRRILYQLSLREALGHSFSKVVTVTPSLWVPGSVPFEFYKLKTHVLSYQSRGSWALGSTT